MKNFKVITAIVLLLVTAFGTISFVEQSKPKKKQVKKTNTTAPKPVVVPSITWYSMTEGFAKAKKEKKMLVIDVYTDWCGWCKVMDQKTYTDAGVVKKMNANFIAVKFNPEVNATHEVNGEKLSSDQLATYLSKGGRIPGYPMTFIWKEITNQATIAPYSGYIEAEPFSTILSKYIQGDSE